MGSILRVCAAMASAIGGVIGAVWAAAVMTVANAATVTALIMGGTWNPLVDFGPQAQTDEFVDTYLNLIASNYLAQASGVNAADLNKVAVYTPEEFAPFTAGDLSFDRSVALGVANLSACISGANACPRNLSFGTPAAGDQLVVFGYSQSTRIAAITKRSLIDYYSSVGWASAPDVSFVLAADVNRPNGGILARFAGLSIPFLGISMDGSAPTNSCVDEQCHFRTTDISFQYDGFSDFPSHPLNVIADLNAVLGIAYQHGLYPFESPLGAPGTVDQGEYGDTHYYLIPAEVLPILVPLVGVLPATWITALDMPLRTIVEMGYSRDISPGEPLAAQWFRFSPVRDAITVAIAIATGIDDAVAQKSGDPSNRPLGTTAISGPFGVPEFSFRDWFDAAHPDSPAGLPLSATVDASTAPVAAQARSAQVNDSTATLPGQRDPETSVPRAAESGEASDNSAAGAESIKPDTPPSGRSAAPPRPGNQPQVPSEGESADPPNVGGGPESDSRPIDDVPSTTDPAPAPAGGTQATEGAAVPHDSSQVDRGASTLGEPVGARR